MRKEREAILDAILELGNFPAGMEVIPAADATPWDIIETIIAESDYYVLIVGGVYGSTDEHGISYTEREYDFAVSQKIPVLAFLHKDPSKIQVGMFELDSTAQKRLSDFRIKVEQRHCKYWSSADELKTQVVIGITQAIRTNPRIGWIRGDSGDTAETLKKLTIALEENSFLKVEIQSLKEALGVRNEAGGQLASGTDKVEIHFRSPPNEDRRLVISWDELFKIAGPLMMSAITEKRLIIHLSQALSHYATLPKESPSAANFKNKSAEIEYDDFDKIIFQFIALDYLEPTTLVHQTESFRKPITEHLKGFKLTKFGAVKLARLLAIRQESNG